MRGPAPTPDAVLRARGSRRAGRPDETPSPPPGRTDPPSWLSEEAREVWTELSSVLEEMGVLTVADRHALARYCRLHVRWRRAEDFIDKHGPAHPLKDGNGNVKCLMPFPQVSEAAKLAVILTRMEQEFGLTPSSRTRVKVDPKFRLSPSARAFREKFMTPQLVAAGPLRPQSAR
jgi:P27 family predicted phage terminase small subunit